MGRRVKAIVLLATFVASGLGLATVGLAYSDGIAGDSGAIAENQRKCQGVQYCKVVPAYCGGCHGSYDEMGKQEGSNPSPQTRVNALTFAIAGDEKAGTAAGKWDYVPNEEWNIDVKLPESRPRGQYNSGGFDLNASAGTLAVLPNDDTVRITGGLFDHQGTKNPNVPLMQGRKYGAHAEDESKWAGEATQTGKGADARSWRIHFRAPPVQAPHGVAFVMVGMLPSGDGLDNCTNLQCNESMGPAPQNQWDWYGFMTPRRILCEKGYYPSYAACSQAVTDFILPPPPPLNTACPPNTGCPTPTSQGTGRGTPAADAFTILGLVGFLGWTLRRRR